jgi:hypothetical protein
VSTAPVDVGLPRYPCVPASLVTSPTMSPRSHRGCVALAATDNLTEVVDPFGGRRSRVGHVDVVYVPPDMRNP